MSGIVEKGAVEELRLALPPEGPQRKVTVRQRDERGVSLLDWACGFGRLDMAAALVREFGAPVNDRHPTSGNTALIAMCATGKAEVAAFLIRDLGADRHAVNIQGATALHVACDKGHTELALMLVRDFSLHLEATHNKGNTPLILAAFGGHTATVIALMLSI